MKLGQDNINVVKSGKFADSKMEIASTPIMYEILQNHMYSDKVGAVIRELCANAYDSHVRAKCESKPFDVVIPSHSNPNFIVRDYGNGLSEESVRNIYAAYGKSDKTISNDEIGCFGIGAKSFFCITDNCQIISRYDGQKYTYSIYTDKDKTPTCSLISQTKTNEPSGMEIRVPVSKYIADFTSKFPHYLRHYETSPNIIGSQVKLKRQETIIFEGSNFKLYSGNNYNGQCNIIMGNIPYTIDYDNTKFGYYNIIDIYAPLGSLDIVASREKLAFNTRTTKTAQDLIDNVYKEIISYINDNVKKQKNYWDATIWVNDNQKLCELHRNIIHSSKKVTGSIYLNSSSYSYTVHVSNSNRKRATYITPNSSYKFYHADLSRGNTNRIKDNSSYLLIKGDLKLFCSDTGYPINKIVACSTLSKPASVKKDYIDGIQIYKNGTTSNVKKVELDTPQYYFHLIYNNIIYDGQTKDWYKFKYLLEQLKTCKIIDPDSYTIYVVRNSKIEKVKEHKWIDFTTTIKEKFDDFIVKNKIQEKIANYQEYIQCTRHYNHSNLMSINYSELNKFKAKVQEMKTEYLNFDNELRIKWVGIQSLMGHFYKSNDIPPLHDITTEQNNIIAKYPILEKINWSYLTSDMIVDYMKLVDDANGS